jgi:hypothetical protein
MKTTLQEFIDDLNNTLDSKMYPSTWSYRDAIVAARDIAELQLEKEKKQMIEFVNRFYDECVMEGGSLQQSAEDYYNQTFNTKEK